MAPSEPLNTVIIGAGGRMGRALARAVAEIPARLRISGAVASAASASLGQDVG